MKHIFLFYIVIILSLISCSDEQTDSSIPKYKENNLELNEEICVNFAYQLHKSFTDNDSLFLSQYILWDSIKSNTFQEFKILENSENQQIWNKVTSKLELGTDFINIIRNNGQIRFITYFTDEKDTSHHIILRTFYPPQQINFYDFSLTSKDEKLCISDIYDYSNASNLSTLLGEEVAFYCNLNSPIKNKIELLDSIIVLKNKINALIDNGNLQMAYATFLTFPEELKATKSLLLLEEQIIFNSENSLVQEVFISKKLDLIPLQEKGRWLTAFYKHAIFQEFEDASIALNNIELEIGEDEFINFLKGVLHFEKKEYKSALKEFNTALASESEIFVLHWNKILTFLEMEDYEKAVESLLVLDDYFTVTNINWDKEFIAYPMFLMSDAYEEWQSRIIVG